MTLILPGTPAWQKMRDPRDRFKALTEILREESVKKLPDLDLYDRISMAREAYRALAVTSLPVLESRRWDAAHNIHVTTNDAGIAERYKQKAIQRMIDRFIEERLGRQIWAVIWKYRQGGVSTKIAEKFYLGVTRGFGQRALVVAQADPEAQVIFEEKYKFMHKYDPLAPEAGKSNPTELSFPSINGHIRVRTAGGRKGVARGGNNKYVHLCVDGDALLPMADGSVARMRDVRVGDGVITHLGNRATVSFKSASVQERVSIRVAMTADPVVVSADHQFFTRNGWKRAADMDPAMDEIAQPVQEFIGGVSDLQFKQPRLNPRRRGEQVRAPERVALDFGLGRLVGLYIAEGSIARQYGSGGQSCVSFGVHRKEVARTLEWLEPYSHLVSGVSVQNRKSSLTSTVNVSGRSFCLFMEGLVGVKDGKRMPPEWWRMPREFIRGLVLGYFSGDGHASMKARMVTISSIRPGTVIHLRYMLAALGYGWASVRRHEAGLRHGRNEREQWIAILSGDGAEALARDFGREVPAKTAERGDAGYQYSMDDEFVWQRIVGLEKLDSGDVFDIEVDHEDHSYCLVQGASHNSECAFYEKEAYKLVGGLLQGVTHPQAMVFMESTANGQAGLFYDTAMEAFNAEKARREGNDPEVETKWEYIFLPWFFEDEAVAGVPFKSEEAKDKFTRGMRDDEKLIQQEFGLTAEQMHWYRIIFDTKSKGETPDAKLMFLQQEFPSRALEAFVAPGSSAFDLPRLVKLTLQAKEPIWQGDITVPGAARGIRPLYDPVAGKFLARTPKPQLTKRVGGPLRVWQRPIAGHRYYSSWDLAQSGSAKADSTEAYIVDYDTHECVAHYMEKGVSNNHLAACRMLSKHYNDAMICPETNFDPSFTASLLDTDRKPFVFWRLQSSESAIKDEASREHGHRTGTSSKPVLVYLLRDALETMPGLFIDKHLLDQMKTFKQVQRTDGSWGYPGAVPGSGTHDDGVIAMGMNLLQMRDRPPMGRSPLSKESEEEKPKPLNPSDMRKGHMEWEEKYHNEQMDGFY